MDISVLDTGKYRKLVLTVQICRPWPGAPGQGLEQSGTTGPHWLFLRAFFLSPSKSQTPISEMVSIMIEKDRKRKESARRRGTDCSP
jgi:hypothetical protein